LAPPLEVDVPAALDSSDAGIEAGVRDVEADATVGVVD